MKHILVFGGTGHIGEAIVRQLLANNVQVTFTFFHNETKALELEKLGAKKIKCEIKSHNDLAIINNLNERYDGAIYAIGINPDDIFVKSKNIEKNYHLLSELPNELRTKLIHLFISGPYDFLDCATKNSTQNSNILFINTLDGVKTLPSPIFFSQCRSSYKGLVESSSKELGKNGIKINQINIGLVESATADKLSHQLKMKYLKYCALNRTATALEIANFSVWFVLNNTYVTGQSIILDGAI